MLLVLLTKKYYVAPFIFLDAEREHIFPFTERAVVLDTYLEDFF